MRGKEQRCGGPTAPASSRVGVILFVYWLSVIPHSDQSPPSVALRCPEAFFPADCAYARAVVSLNFFSFLMSEQKDLFLFQETEGPRATRAG